MTSQLEPILRLSARVSVDLDHDGDHYALDLDRLDRRALAPLADVPAGARVRVSVGTRTLLTMSAVQWLHSAAQRLDVEIDAADAGVVWLWHRAITDGVLW